MRVDCVSIIDPEAVPHTGHAEGHPRGNEGKGSPGAGSAGANRGLRPLAASKLPVGRVRARGWLAGRLRLMGSGMVGRLEELSVFLNDDESWTRQDGKRNQTGGNRCEELPYWLRGAISLAALTDDEALARRCRSLFDRVFENQQDDGYFGPVDFGTYGGTPPRYGSGNIVLMIHALMLDAVVRHHELTEDPRVLPFMLRFFEYCERMPDELFFANDETVWHRRPCDLIEHIHWCYDRTGEDRLLALAARFFKRFPHITDPYPSRESMLNAGVNDRLTRRRHDEWLVHHTVDFTHYYRAPAMFSRQSRDPWHLQQSEYWYRQHLLTWGQQPRGIYGADEVIRSTYTDPRQGCETCTMVELNKGFYLLGQITGNSVYADRCEDVTFNHLPASQTPDLKGLHYLTASNQPQLDAQGDHDFANGSGQLLYSPHRFRCCQHNISMGWPWFVEHMWLASHDRGLVAWLYGPCEVTAKVGEDDSSVSIQEDTEYPFRESVSLRISADEDVRFPLYLRIPRWCEGFGVSVNGTSVRCRTTPGSYLRIDRLWKNGDRVEIRMPMNVQTVRWPRTGSVSVDRGPLTYSVRIEEEWRRCGGTDEWPEWEVLPAGPWNYGLLLDGGKLGEVEVREAAPPTDQPWTVAGAPVELRVSAKRIPAWRLTDGMVQELQLSPIRSSEASETIRMIPMGSARLRMACLPVVDNAPHAREWQETTQGSDTRSTEWA